MKHNIYLVRHGLCKGNVSGEVLLPSEDLLTDYGRLQATALGELLKDIHFSKAIASTYPRAIETAERIIAKNANPCPIQQEPRIREREMEFLIGVPPRVKYAVLKVRDGTEIEIPEAETIPQFVHRIKTFFKELLEDLKGASEPQTILLVSHGLVIRRFLTGLKDSLYTDIFTVDDLALERCLFMPDNTAYTQFTIEYLNDCSLPSVKFLKIHFREHLQNVEGNKPTVEPKNNHKLTEKQRKWLEQEVTTIIPELSDILKN